MKIILICGLWILELWWDESRDSTDLKLRTFLKNEFFQIEMTEKIKSKIVKMTTFWLQMMTSFERKKSSE